MQLPGSMNMAPPPEMRRTTPIPWRAAPSGSISLRKLWKLPITTSGAFQSQNRNVGGRTPSATSLVITSSRATCMAGFRVTGAMTSNVWSPHPVAWPRARRTAIPTAAGVKPMRETPSLSAPVMA